MIFKKWGFLSSSHLQSSYTFSKTHSTTYHVQMLLWWKFSTFIHQKRGVKLWKCTEFEDMEKAVLQEEELICDWSPIFHHTGVPVCNLTFKTFNSRQNWLSISPPELAPLFLHFTAEDSHNLCPIYVSLLPWSLNWILFFF